MHVHAGDRTRFRKAAGKISQFSGAGKADSDSIKRRVKDSEAQARSD